MTASKTFSDLRPRDLFANQIAMRIHKPLSACELLGTLIVPVFRISLFCSKKQLSFMVSKYFPEILLSTVTFRCIMAIILDRSRKILFANKDIVIN